MVALKFVVKKLVDVLLVDELLTVTRFVAVAYVLLRRVIVPEAEVRSAMFALEIVVVARVEVPVTTKRPVVVELTTLRPLINAVATFKMLAKKLVEDALVKFANVEKRLVDVA